MFNKSVSENVFKIGHSAKRQISLSYKMYVFPTQTYRHACVSPLPDLNSFALIVFNAGKAMTWKGL